MTLYLNSTDLGAMSFSYLYSQHRLAWISGCIALIVLIALGDYVTGYELSLAILYLAPIFLATWVLGRGPGIAISVFALAAWLISVDYMGFVYAHPLLHFWEALIRLATWIIFVVLLARLKISLAHADERFVTVLEGLDAAVYVADTQSGELLYSNKECRAAFGSGERLFRLRQIESRFAPPPPRAISGDPRPPERTGAEGEFHDLVADRWYLIHSRAIRWIDGRMVALHVATDITLHKQIAELSRQQQEKLQLTSRLISVGEMASTLAHELNQPLAAIANYNMGCVRRLRAGSWDNAELLEAMEKSGAQVERAGKIIQRVRELVRRRDPQRLAMNVNVVIAEIARMLEIHAEKHGVRVTLELAPALPSLLGDKVMIEQALLNLTRNAIEAMQDTPAAQRDLTIRSSHNGSGTLEIEVRDSGCGIPPALTDKLFTPFFTTKPDGMGIGLHICRSIAEFHDGHIRASRNPDAGSTFRLVLPLHTT